MVEYESQTDAVFRAMADPTRRAMVEQLSKGSLSVGDLARPFDMSLAGASKHLGVLEEAGIIEREKRGRERVCTLKPHGLFALRDWVQTYSRFWEMRFDRLDKALQEDDGDV